MIDTMPRVLMLARAVFPLHGYGGIERHVFHLVTHVLRLGVDMTLVVGRALERVDDGAAAEAILLAASLPPSDQFRVRQLRYDLLSPLLRPNGIVGRQINYPIFSLREAFLARRLIKAGEVDIVHAQGLCAWGFAVLRRFDRTLKQVPFIANPHGMEEYRTPSRLKRWAYAPFRQLYSAGTRAADRAIATDACTVDDLPRFLGVDPEKVVVIPSAIDTQECLAATDAELGAAVHSRLGLEGRDPVLLSVGRLEHNKGYHVLADALAQIREKLGPHWRWVLVGTGKQESALRRQAEDLGFAEHVVFAGQLSDRELHSLYEMIDVFVHPTLYEGSSLVTLEAMLHQRPVVASAVGGIPDKVFSGRNGMIVPPGDVGALAHALLTTLDLPNQWRAWGEEGRRIVEQTFDWPIVARRTLREYERMLQTAPKPVQLAPSK